MTSISNKTYPNPGSEAVFRPSRQRSQPRIEYSFDLITLVNAKGIVTSVSPSITALLGYAPEAIVGCHAGTLVHPDDRDILQQVLAELEQTPGGSLKAEYRLRSQDGAWHWFEGSGTNLLQVPGISALVIHFRQSRQRALAPRWNKSKLGAWEHTVQFYETDGFLVDALSSFIETGLGAGETCIVIVTQAHRERLEQRLQAKGLDLAAAHTRGEYLALDAAETLATFMANEVPVPGRFAEVMGSLIGRAAQSRRPVRIFGEMVALLWAEGNQAAAICLEALWNELHNTYPFSLCCGYPMHGFAGDGYEGPFTAICQQHSRVIPAESYTALTSPDERLRAISHLQQQANSLQAEIAERKAAAERLRISENRYRRLFEASKDGILLVDPGTGAITDANPALTELLGYTREQVLGQELWHIGLFENREATLKALRESQEYHVPRYETLPLHTKEGQPRYVEFMSTQFQVNGHIVIHCNLRDLTERRKLEQRTFEALTALLELARSLAWPQHEAEPPTMQTFAPQLAELARRVLDCERVALTLCDADTGALKALAMAGAPGNQSAQWQALLDGASLQDYLTPEAIATLQTGASLVVDLTPPRLRKVSLERMMALVTPMQIAEHLVGFLSYDYGQVAHTFTPQEQHLAEAVSQLAVFVLERERWLVERSATQAHLLALEETTRQMDAFLSIVAHELRTPITSLKTSIQLVRRRIDQELDGGGTLEGRRPLTPAELLGRTEAQVRRLTRLIDDLVDLARIRSSKLEVRLELCDVGQVVTELVENERLVSPNRLIHFEPPTQPLLAWGDPDRLGQVGINYLTNALKYAPPDRLITVRVQQEGRHVWVGVQDQGPGIPLEEQERIWEMFHRVPGIEVQSGSGIGLGLGLHISKRMIERQGGQVGVESVSGQGSTFWFTLPLAPPESPEPPPA